VQAAAVQNAWVGYARPRSDKMRSWRGKITLNRMTHPKDKSRYKVPVKSVVVPIAQIGGNSYPNGQVKFASQAAQRGGDFQFILTDNLNYTLKTGRQNFSILRG